MLRLRNLNFEDNSIIYNFSCLFASGIEAQKIKHTLKNFRKMGKWVSNMLETDAFLLTINTEFNFYLKYDYFVLVLHIFNHFFIVSMFEFEGSQKKENRKFFTNMIT